MNIHDILLTMSVIKDGEWDGIYRLLKEKVPLTDEQVRDLRVSPSVILNILTG